MLLTPHILAGATIVTLVQNPILGLIFVLLSHYFLDLLPHKEYAIKAIRAGQWSKSVPDFSKAFLDIIIGLAIVLLTIDPSPLILIAILLAILPDGATVLYCIFPTNRLLHKHFKINLKINNIYANKKIPAFWGIVSQVVVITTTIYLLI